jgi:hypothetical protein
MRENIFKDDGMAYGYEPSKIIRTGATGSSVRMAKRGSTLKSNDTTDTTYSIGIGGDLNGIGIYKEEDLYSSFKRVIGQDSIYLWEVDGRSSAHLGHDSTIAANLNKLLIKTRKPSNNHCEIYTGRPYITNDSGQYDFATKALADAAYLSIPVPETRKPIKLNFSIWEKVSGFMRDNTNFLIEGDTLVIDGTVLIYKGSEITTEIIRQ